MFNNFPPSSSSLPAQVTNSAQVQDVYAQMNTPRFQLPVTMPNFSVPPPKMSFYNSTWANPPEFGAFNMSYNEPANFAMSAQHSLPFSNFINTSPTNVSTFMTPEPKTTDRRALTPIEMSVPSFSNKEPIPANKRNGYFVSEITPKKSKILSDAVEKAHISREFSPIKTPTIKSEVHLVERKEPRKERRFERKNLDKSASVDEHREKRSSSKGSEKQLKKKKNATKGIRSEVHRVEKPSTSREITPNQSREIRSEVRRVEKPSTINKSKEVRRIEKPTKEIAANKVGKIESVNLTRTITNDAGGRKRLRIQPLSPPPMSVILIDEDETVHEQSNQNLSSNAKELLQSTKEVPQTEVHIIKKRLDAIVDIGNLDPQQSGSGVNSLNWRCRAMFNGKWKVDDIEMNCQRPQTSEGRTFPASKKYYEGKAPDSSSPTDNSHAYNLSPQLNARLQAATNSPNTSLHVHHKTTVHSIERKRFTNRSLRIIGGKRIYDQSDECFHFISNNRCQRGVFCAYAHDGDKSHMNVKICARLLQGKCRNGKTCPNGHNLEEHQMPVCDFFLSMKCSHRDCEYLHVKHSDAEQPCADFNKGICEKGIMCEKPHRYRYSIIKERGKYLQDVNSDTDVDPTVTSEAGNDLLKWFV